MTNRVYDILKWLAMVVLLVAVTVITDFIALGTLAVSVAAPVGIWLVTGTKFVPLILCIATVVMVCKHRENISRICNRTEIGLRSTVKGEKRVQ